MLKPVQSQWLMTMKWQYLFWIVMYNFYLICHKCTQCQQYSHLLWPLPFPNTSNLHVLMWHLFSCLSTISCCYTPKLLRMWQEHWQSSIYLSAASVHPQSIYPQPPYAWRNKTPGWHADERAVLLLLIAFRGGKQWDAGIEPWPGQSLTTYPLTYTIASRDVQETEWTENMIYRLTY